MNKLDLIATSAFGLEAVVANELKKLGYENLVIENGRVAFQASLADIARCNLWLRSADRVLLKIGEFEAYSFEELFEKTKSLPWADWIPKLVNFRWKGNPYIRSFSASLTARL